MSHDPTYRGYQAISDMTQVEPAMSPFSWNSFVVNLSGKTNNTHEQIVQMLREAGHAEVFTPEDSDYCLLFCTIVSRVESDMTSALRHSPDKPTVLVLMYHTSQENYNIPENRRLTVEDPRVRLIVSCLFFENKLLKCNRNDIARHDIRRFLGFPQEAQAMSPCREHRRLLIGLFVLVVVGVFIILLVVLIPK